MEKIDLIKGMSPEERTETLIAFSDKELMDEIMRRLAARQESLKAIKEALL